MHFCEVDKNNYNNYLEKKMYPTVVFDLKYST